MRISRSQLFLKICLKLNFRQIKNVVLWYHQEREKEREERKKRERQERAGFPSPFTPNPLRREKRESKEREKREKERVPASGEKLSWRCVRGVCRLCGGKAGRNSIYYYRHITPRIFSYLNNRMQAI